LQPLTAPLDRQAIWEGKAQSLFFFSIWRSQVEEGNHGKIVAIDIDVY